MPGVRAGREVAAGGAFGALGLAARAGVTDDEVRGAWRRVAAATHPDRADGGDPAAFAAAAAAYSELRTRFGRGEVLAELAAADGRPPPARPAIGPVAARPARPPSTSVPAASIAARRRRGVGRRAGDERWSRLAGRSCVAFVGCVLVVGVDGMRAASVALIVGAVVWLVRTSRLGRTVVMCAG
jgi:hypothetical protein